MKKILLVLVLTILAMSCATDNNDANQGGGASQNRVTLTFEGDYWNSLIDNPQYNGNLLYKQEGYSWYDEATDLYSTVNELWYTAAYWNGGLAVSNYYTTDYTTAPSMMQQLTVFAEGAHSGSNCIVHNGYKCDMMGDARSVLQFKSSQGYIESMWVAHTAFSYNSAVLGNDMVAPLTSEQSIWIEAKGYTLDAEGKEIEGNALTLYLYENGKASFDGWIKWDLSALGKVNKVKFDVQWNGEGGADKFMHPAYFALDDITVVKE